MCRGARRMIEDRKDSINERLAFRVSFESAFVTSQEEDGASMALPEKVLAHVSPVFVLECHTVDALRCLEVGHGKLDLHDVPPCGRPKLGMLPTIAFEIICRLSQEKARPKG